MKAVACLVGLCLLAGIVTADYAWESGKQYKYKVSTRALTGITEINNKYAGLQFTYDQIMTPVGGNVVNVKIENLEVIEVNEELEQGWRQGPIQQGRVVEIPEELKHYVTSPMDMTVVKGVVESIKVDSRLPTWAVNIKKAQASTFTLDTTGKNVVVEGNLNRQTNAVRPEEANQESGFFFEVLEQTVHGECEVYYTVSQNGPFDYPYQFQKQAQAARQGQQGSQSGSSSSSESQEVVGKRQYQRNGYKLYRQAVDASSSSSSSESSSEESGEKAWPKTYAKLCDTNDQIYEIIKTVNFTTCRQKPVLAFSSPAEYNFRPADNAGGSLWARALVTRLIACGQNRKNYTILKITQQERFQTGLQDKEKVVAGAQKNVTLISIREGQPTPVQNPKTINNLVYKYEKDQVTKSKGQLRMARVSSSVESYEHVPSNEQEQQSGEQDPLRFSWSNIFSGKKGRRSSQENSQEQGRQRQRGQRRHRTRSGEQYGSNEMLRDSPYIQRSSEQQRQSSSESAEEGQQGQEFTQLEQPNLDEAPLVSMMIPRLNREQIKTRVNELMGEIVEDLTRPTQAQGESIAKRETLSKINSVVKALRTLNTQGIEEVARRWISISQQTQQEEREEEKQQVGQQIFVEALAIAGTNPAVKFLTKLIETGELVGERAAQILSSLPMYIRTPTKELLKQLFQLLENEKVKLHEQTRTSAILGFTTLVYQACVNKKIKNTRYPVALYGEFCGPQLVQTEFTPYFIQKLQKHLESNQPQDKHMIFVYFKALGNLGVPEILPVVQKALDRQTEPNIKATALYALRHLLQSRDYLNQNQEGHEIKPVDRESYDVVTDKIVEKHVLPILVSVAFDRGEHPSVRIAAFDLLFFCTYADTTLWQQAAMSTWFESSRDVRAFIYNILKHLAELQQPLKGIRYVQQQRARKVFTLVKPIDASIARSNHIFTSHFIEPVNTGFEQQLQYTASHDSIIPNHIFYKNYYQFGNGAAGISPVEIGVTGQTISKLIFAAYKSLYGKSQEQQGHPELHEIHQLLNIQERKQDDPVVGTLFLNVRNEVQRMWTVDEQTVEQLAQQLVQKLVQGGQKEMDINYHKVGRLAEQVAVMPTILGFPLVYRMRMSALVSVRGTVKITNPSGPEFQVQADLAPVYAWKVTRQLSFKTFLTQKKYVSGVQRHVVVELPMTVVARKAPRGQIQVAITPAHLTRGAPSGTIDLVTYHQTPYTAIIHDEFYPVVHPKGGKMEIVRVNHEQQEQFTRTRTFGQNTLGLSLHAMEKSDYPEEREHASGWAHFFRRFHTANCAFNAAWLGSPSIRFVERKLVLNIDQSETKTILLVGGARFQRVSVIEKLQSSEETESQENQHQSGSSSSSSSSSSESEEGKRFFNIVRSPKNYQMVQQQYHQQQARLQARRQQRQQQSRRSGSSSSSSSSESGEHRPFSSSESQEQSQERRSGSQERQQGGKTRGPQRNVIAIALLGKKAPLQSIDELRSGVQRPLQKGSQNTVQYLLHLAQSAQGKVFIRLAVGDAANEAAESMPESRSLLAVREAVVDSPNTKNQPDACVEFQGTIDTPKKASRHVIAYTRESLLKQNLFVKVQAKLQAGSKCNLMPLYVKIEGKLKRDQEMTEWARSKSPEAKLCKRDEKKGFSVSQICLRVAKEQAAALNVIDLNIQHSHLTPELKNVTAQFETLIKNFGYLYLSENQQPESTPVQRGQLQLWARMTPCKRFVSVHIRQPESILKFENMKTNKLVKTILPLTATQSLLGNINRRLFRSQFHPTCQLEGNYVNTFDNVTYSFNRQVVSGCETLLVKDCSGRHPMAVFAKNIQKDEQQVVSVLLGQQTKIQLLPQGTSKSKTSEGMTVRVNGQQVNLPHIIRSKESRNQKPIAEIMMLPNGGVQVIGRRIKVASDGQRILLQVSELLRNRTCGICGDFDSEKVAEMRSPRDVPLSSGSLLVASYSFSLGQSQSQCEVNPRIESQYKKEEKQFQGHSYYTSKNYRHGQDYVREQRQRRRQQYDERKQFLQSVFGPKQKYPSFSSESSESEEATTYRPRYSQSLRESTPDKTTRRTRYGKHQPSEETADYQQSSELRQSSRQGGQEIILQQRVVRNPQNSQETCFSLNKLPVCGSGYKPKKLTQKVVKAYCIEQQSKIQQLKEQILSGQYHDFSSKPLQQIRVAVPERCAQF